MNTDLPAEAMELDSAPPLPPNPEAVQRYLDAKAHATSTARAAKELKQAASTSPEANEAYQAARLASRQAYEAAEKIKLAAGIPSRPRKRKPRTTRKVPRVQANAMTGVKMSTTSGITKKTKEKKPKVTKQPLHKSSTGTGVYGWSVNDGEKELDPDEIRELQEKHKMRLLLPPPQMEAEAAAAGFKNRRERKDIARALAMATAAEEAHDKQYAERMAKRKAAADRKAGLQENLMGELQELETDQREFMGKVTIVDLRKEEACKERVKAVGALQKRSVEENTEIDAIAEQLGLVSMGRKRAT